MSCSLNEKSTELIAVKNEYRTKEADLIHKVEELKHRIKELKDRYVCTYMSYTNICLQLSHICTYAF